MARYIVSPKRPRIPTLSYAMNRRFSLGHRVRQIRETLALRSDDPVVDDITRWLRAEGSKAVSVLSRIPSRVPTESLGFEMPISGSMVLEMTEEAARALASDIPGASVLLDQKLDLITPTVALETRREVLAEADTWHLDLTGVRQARQGSQGATGKDVVVAVLDTGIEESHPEIKGSVLESYTFDVTNWSPVRMAESVDTQGHGTHVAGLIAGKTVGVAPDANLIDGLMLRGGLGMLSDFILAMEAVAGDLDTPAQIINMSAGLQGFFPEMAEAVAGILAVGALPVFAVGNEGRNRTRSPGNYIDPISVGACNQQKKVASFSGSGSILFDHHQYSVPDVVAPGDKVFSCVKGGGYEAWSGTSMAAPIVSGIAALILERHPAIPAPELVEEILRKCENLDEDPIRQGKGLVRFGP